MSLQERDVEKVPPAPILESERFHQAGALRQKASGAPIAPGHGVLTTPRPLSRLE